MLRRLVKCQPALSTSGIGLSGSLSGEGGAQGTDGVSLLFTNRDELCSFVPFLGRGGFASSPSPQGCKEILAATPLLGTFLRASSTALRR